VLHLLSLDIGDAYAEAIGRLLVVAPNRSGAQSARGYRAKHRPAKHRPARKQGDSHV
jgi:transcriptional regulator GlxA family with amidase domain